MENEVSKHDGVYSHFTELNKIYDGDEVATVRKYITFAGVDFMVMASVDFEAGYYEGFALDWSVKRIEGVDSMIYFEELPDVAECADLLEYNTSLNTGLCKALAPKLAARLETALSEATDVIENALKVISPYHLTGLCMNNGEGIYTNHKAS